MQIDEFAALLDEFARGCEPPVHVAAAPTDGRNDARENDLVVADDEPALDPRFGGAVAHRAGIGAAATQQFERVDEQGLARTGLARDHGHARGHRHEQFFDDAEVLDAEFGQHQRSGSENLALRIWWKSRGRRSTMCAGSAAALHVTRSPSVSTVTRRPSIVHTTSRPPLTTKSSCSCPASTSERSNNMCGEIGVSSKHCNAGDAIGPRTENEYAVLPVGVATMTPSAAYVVNGDSLIDRSRRTKCPG